MQGPIPGKRLPAEAWAEVRSLRMRYFDWGGEGAPVLALHGLASSAHWYDILAPFLCERFRIVAPDQRGHGRTTQAADGYGWRSLASDAVGLLDVLGIEQAVLIGHSWGANVAVGTAAHFPGRVRAIVMIDGGFVGPEMVSGGTWEDFSSRFAPRDVSGTRSDFLARFRGLLEVCWNSEVERIVQTMVEERDGQIQDILRPGNHEQILRAMWYDPTSDYWPRIGCPALMVTAGSGPPETDSEWDRDRRRLVKLAAEAIPDCRVHWIPDTIHDIGYHKPRELAQAILEFVDSF